jgi:hypothetical protein
MSGVTITGTNFEGNFTVNPGSNRSEVEYLRIKIKVLEQRKYLRDGEIRSRRVPCEACDAVGLYHPSSLMNSYTCCGICHTCRGTGFVLKEVEE